MKISVFYHKTGDAMKYFRKWFFPSTERCTNIEIDSSNLKNIFYLSLVVSCIQFVALMVFIISNIRDIASPLVYGAIFNVATSILIFLVALPITGRLRKSPAFVAAHHKTVNTVAVLYCVIFLIWGMVASARVYMMGRQVITFYIVELCVVLFVKLRPWISVLVVFGSYYSYFAYLDIFLKQGMINPYNYLMLALLSTAGAITNYHLTVDNIEKKNKIESLNKSLQRFASHDSLTRLQNRHALNQDLSEYLHTDICVAMGDINQFKQINDRFGHQTGDVILKHVADVLLAVFPAESVYRYGGDEFLIIWKNSSAGDFEKSIAVFNDRLSKYRIQDTDQSVSCSFGFVCSRAETNGELIRLISQADKKLYEQKKQFILTK